jgi:hypothetical protein
MKPRSKRARLPGRDIEEVRERDPDGAIVVHHRTVDSLGKMLKSGTIDQAMHDAARRLPGKFHPCKPRPDPSVADPAGTGHGTGA